MGQGEEPGENQSGRGRQTSRPLPSAPVDVHTFTVGELNQALQLALDVVFPDEIWVEGEISSLNRSAAGHVYFQLVEPGRPGEPPEAQLAVTLFAGNKAAVNQTLKRVGGVRMTDGVAIRVRGRVGIYPAQGRLQLRMTAIDPAYTLGRLAADRERILRTLADEGLLARNGELALPARPLRVALLTSAGSAAEADFVHELTQSGLAWQIMAVDVRVQGADAAEVMAASLRRLAADHGAHPDRPAIDVVALVRGGGARSDLAAFDSEALARAIASMPVPVITGIGHEVDRSVADLVAHTAYKTPTACAAHLVATAVAFHQRAEHLAGDIGLSASRAIVRADHRLARHGTAVARAAETGTVRAQALLDQAWRRVPHAAARSHELASVRLEALGSRINALDPRRALERGWSITRTADGTLVRSTAAVAPGRELLTTLADGTVRSRVSATEPGPDADPREARPRDLPPSGARP